MAYIYSSSILLAFCTRFLPAFMSLHSTATMPTSYKDVVLETGKETVPSTSASDELETAPISLEEERRLVRKLDLVILPVFFVIYTMSFLDRINISNARIQGMVEDLDLTGNRFNIALFVSC